MGIRERWRALAGREDGNVALTFSLAFPVLLGAAGLAVDSAAFYDQHARMQTVADAAALAVAKELHIYRDDLAELKAIGEERAEALLAESGIGHRPHTAEVGINPADNLVEVEIVMVADGFLPPEIWGENPIRVTSQARAYGQSKLCVLALHPDKSGALKAASAAQLTAPECAVQSNSANSSGLDVADDSRIASTIICSSGGVKGGETSFDPRPETDCTPLDDPLSSRPPPALSGCTFNDLVIDASETLPGDAVFCGGLKIEKGAEVTLSPGIYVISGGKLEVTDTSKLIGEYVSFYFQDDAATFVFEPNTTIDLGAPKDGPMAGILIYENPASAIDRDFTIKSENAKRLLGTIYLPNGRLMIDTKGAVADESAYTVIVARQLHIKGANLVVNADYAGTDVPVPDGVGPNSSMIALSR
jgi:hypothetical protein